MYVEKPTFQQNYVLQAVEAQASISYHTTHDKPLLTSDWTRSFLVLVQA